MAHDLLLFLLVSATSAAAVTCTKFLVQTFPPFFLLALRLLSASLFFLFLGRKRFGQFATTVSKSELFLMLRAALVGIYGSLLLEAVALQLMASAKAAFFYTLAPFVAAVFSFVFHKELLTIQKAIALLLGFAGLIPLLTAEAPSEGKALFLSVSAPELVMGLSVLLYTYGWILILQLARSSTQSTKLINATIMAVAGVAAAITSVFFEPQFYTHIYQSFNYSISAAVAFSVLVLLGTVFCYAIYLRLLRYHSATHVTLVEFTTPLYAAFYGSVFLKERITAAFWFSSTMVFIALFLFYTSKSPQSKT